MTNITMKSRPPLLLLQLLILLGGALLLHTNAHACKWHDAKCLAKEAEVKAARKAAALNEASAKAAQQAAAAADAAARQAADQAAAAAAAAKAQAEAAFAALVAEKRQELDRLKSTYSQAGNFTQNEFNRVAAAANPFVSPFVSLVQGCMDEIQSESAGLVALADQEVATGSINGAFQDASDDRAACATAITSAAQELARQGQKLAPTEIDAISNAIHQAGPCLTRPDTCAAQALESFYDAQIQDLVKAAAKTAVSNTATVTSGVTGVLNGAGEVTEALYRVMRQIPTGKLTDQGKRDLYAVIKFLKLEKSGGTVGLFFAPAHSAGAGAALYYTMAFDTRNATPTFRFLLSSAPMVGNDTTVKLGLFWSPHSGNEVANKSIGYPVPVPIPDVPPQYSGMLYPQWLMPALTANLTQDLNNIKDSLSKSPTFMAGFMFGANTGWIPTALPVAPLRTQILNMTN